MMTWTAALALLTWALHGSTVGADWPNWRGPAWDGKSPETGINKDWKTKPPKELWRIKMSDEGFAGPCIAGGKLFITDHDAAGNQDLLRAIDANTGKDLWRYGFPTVAAPNYGWSNATPAFDANRLYLLSRSGQLHCLDPEKGTRIWMRDLKADFKANSLFDFSSSPVIDGNNLIIATGGPNLMVALNKETGADAWKSALENAANCCTPLVAALKGKRQCMVFTFDKLVSVDASTGQKLWELPATYYIPSPIVAGDNIFYGATGSAPFSCALVTPEGTKVWENQNIAPHLGTPIYADGYVYGTTGPKQSGGLACIDAKTGAFAWQQNEGGFGELAMIAVDGVFLAFKDGGQLVMANLTPKAYEELGRLSIGGRGWTAPAVADGKLFIRNEQALVCFNLR